MAPVSLGTTTADASGDWSYDYTGTSLADGNYTLTAQATDTATAQAGAVSAGLNFTVDATGPAATAAAISVDTGLADNITSDTTLVFSGTAEAGNTVEVFLDNGGGAVSLGTTTADGAGNWSFDHTGTSLADGNYTLTAQATDTATAQAGSISAGLAFVIDTSGPSGSVLIDNTNPIQGDVLTATNSVGDVDGLGPITYHWQRDTGAGFVDIGVTGSSYTTTQADVNNTIRVEARYTDGSGNNEVVASTATAAVINVNDAPVGNLLLSNLNPTEGEAIAATPAFSDLDGISGAISYEWRRDGNIIAGATGSVYFTTQDDVGARLTATARYVDDLGTIESVTSTSTAPVGNFNADPTGTVTIDNNTPSQGDTLLASNTLADRDGISGSISYQWQRDGVNIAGATGASFVTTQADVGSTLSVVASYVDDFGTNESVSSGNTSSVLNVNDAPTGAVTINNLTPAQGDVLSAANTLADIDGLSGVVAYQWQRDGFDIDGQNGTIYVTTQADVGAVISVTATYIDDQGTAESIGSIATAAVVDVNDTATGSVTISGNAVEDAVLTAAAEPEDLDGIASDLDYQWQRDGVAIDGAVGTTYTLTQQDVGAEISVVTQFTDGAGNAEFLTSENTDGVANVNDAPLAELLDTSQDSTAGRTLFASSLIEDEDGISGPVVLQWYRDGSAIPDAYGESYLLSEADVGSMITVVAQLHRRLRHD